MKKNSNLQLNIGNEKLYFDVDEFMDNITYVTGNTVDKATEINLPKFEFFKSMVDTICNIVEDVDDKLGVVSLNKLSICFLKNKIFGGFPKTLIVVKTP